MLNIDLVGVLDLPLRALQVLFHSLHALGLLLVKKKHFNVVFDYGLVVSIFIADKLFINAIDSIFSMVVIVAQVF